MRSGYTYKINYDENGLFNASIITEEGDDAATIYIKDFLELVVAGLGLSKDE